MTNEKRLAYLKEDLNKAEVSRRQFSYKLKGVESEYNLHVLECDRIVSKIMELKNKMKPKTKQGKGEGK